MRINDVDLCVETFGDPADPAILLIMGSGASMDFWEDEFCARLQAGGRFVIRYDHRDTGQSIAYQPGKPEYTGADLIADAIGVVEALGLARAHVVGMSAGGAIAQLVALDHPERVASLTLISTSPAGPDDDLPGWRERARAAFSVPRPDLADRPALLDWLTEQNRALAGTARPFDAARNRALWDRVLDRTRNIESALGNHDLLEGPERWRERLPGLNVPTLVIHGTDDPFLPYEHGVALAREIPAARLLALEHTGHELPRAVWDVVVPAVLDHTSCSSAARTQPGRSW
jgi:pimeloyl-ACP methyl ester carboxylesterase